MNLSPDRMHNRRAGAWTSLGIHTLALVLAAGGSVALRRHPRTPVESMRFVAVGRIEISGASHAIPVPLPPDPAAAHTRHPAPNTTPVKKSPLPSTPPVKPALSGCGAPPAPHTDDGSGQALRGKGADAVDAQPAFPVYSPSPHVADRGLLPAIQQKIVVDVRVDEAGGVVGETLVQGMGTPLDQIVLDTVKTWRFHPATVNGKPVPTESELIFPFDLRYPIAAAS